MKKTIFDVLFGKQYCDPIEYVQNAGDVYEMMENGATFEEIEDMLDEE